MEFVVSNPNTLPHKMNNIESFLFFKYVMKKPPHHKP
jgi:hypothetical protein